MPTTTASDLHREIQQLLPWYINQTLSYEQHQQVEQHLKQCLVCRREWLNLQKLAEQIIAPSDLEVSAEASFARLRMRLGKHCQAKSVSSTPIPTSLPSRRYQRAAIASLSLAASLLLLIGLSIWPTEKAMVNFEYTTLSASQPIQSEHALLKVVFAKEMSSEVMDELLARIQAQKIGQANSMGAFTIKLDTASHMTTDQALALLRSHRGVLLAEPVRQ